MQDEMDPTVGQNIVFSITKARVQKYSSDTLFTPKIDIFKQTILNTA